MKDYFFLAFNNLRRRKLRAWLTILGIFIGIAAVVSLISIGQGLQDYINTQFEQVGGDKILVQGKTLGSPGSTTNPELLLTEKDLETIRNVRGVEAAEGALTKVSTVKFRDETEVAYMSGVDEKYLEIFGNMDALKVIAGRQLKDSDRSKAVVGYNHVYGDLWNKPANIGNKLEIQGKEFEIIGVLAKQGNPFDDGAVWLQKDVFRELLDTGNDEGTIVVKTKPGFNPDDVAENIKRELRRERNEKEGQETFTVQSFSQLMETFSSIFAVVQAVFVGIAAISLLVGGIGIMNTMYTAVMERTKEIGTMKAVGAKNSDILLIFLFESGLLGLVGGVIGVLIGIGIAKTVEYVALQYLGTSYLRASITPTLVIGALLFSFIVGTFAGVLPALQAAKLQPVDALRSGK